MGDDVIDEYCGGVPCCGDKAMLAELWHLPILASHGIVRIDDTPDSATIPSVQCALPCGGCGRAAGMVAVITSQIKAGCSRKTR